jgi:hypothetical protein
MQTKEEMLEELKEVMQFKYFITPDDLYKSKFPYAKVLQSVWIGAKEPSPRVEHVRYTFKEYIADNLIYLRRLDLLQINATIYGFVDTLRKEYPECFEDVGFYTRRKLAEAYMQGTLISNGKPVSDEDVEARMQKIIDNVELYKLASAKRQAEETERLQVAYQEAMSNYYDDFSPMYEGYMFKNKKDVLIAYRDIADKGTQIERLEKIREYVDVEYTGKGWLVQKILKEDSMNRVPPAYPMPVLRRR